MDHQDVISDRALGAHERRERILALATTGGPSSVELLSDHFGVTASTIRRDLARLTSQGRLARTYGGAIAINAHPESSLGQRTSRAFPAKRSIARWAARTIVSGEAVLLDAGSTVAALAHELRARAGVQVTSSSLAVMDELAGADTDLICLGGSYRALSHAFVGPITEMALGRMTFDRAFLSADGVSAKHGVCEANHNQTRLKEVMAARAENVFVLADSTKLEHRPFHAWAHLQTPWTLVTDENADREHLSAFAATGVDVIVVSVEHPGHRVDFQPA